jgi:hypothetical protein
MQDKRQQGRVSISIPVLCELDNELVIGGTTSDIGLGGSRIICPAPPPFGTALTLTVRLPGGSDLSHLPAVVRWTSDGEFGVQFGLLGIHDTRLITELMANTRNGS